MPIDEDDEKLQKEIQDRETALLEKKAKENKTLEDWEAIDRAKAAIDKLKADREAAQAAQADKAVTPTKDAVSLKGEGKAISFDPTAWKMTNPDEKPPTPGEEAKINRAFEKVYDQLKNDFAKDNPDFRVQNGALVRLDDKGAAQELTQDDIKKFGDFYDNNALNIANEVFAKENIGFKVDSMPPVEMKSVLASHVEETPGTPTPKPSSEISEEKEADTTADTMSKGKEVSSTIGEDSTVVNETMNQESPAASVGESRQDLNQVGNTIRSSVYGSAPKLNQDKEQEEKTDLGRHP